MSGTGGFRIDVDLSAVGESLTRGAERGVRLAVEHLLTEANKSVPHDEGTLERSGEATVDGTRGAVSYDTPYAVRQHEDMSVGHPGKGKPKWLENTLASEATTVGQIITQAIRAEVGT